MPIEVYTLPLRNHNENPKEHAEIVRRRIEDRLTRIKEASGSVVLQAVLPITGRMGASSDYYYIAAQFPEGEQVAGQEEQPESAEPGDVSQDVVA
jgi:hypothetical protein